MKDTLNSSSRPPLRGTWQVVDLPHTWNTKDVYDDKPGYYRGAAWYRKDLNVLPSWKDKSIYLCFEGAAQETEVYVNGELAGSHTGSYTAFSVSVKKFLNFEQAAANHIVIKVNNRFNEDIPPLSADFTFFGGLYRDVRLKISNPLHFGETEYGSDGVFISTPDVSNTKAAVNIRGSVLNSTSKQGNLKIVSTVTDASGRQVAASQTSLQLSDTGSEEFGQQLSIDNPHLWSPGQPYLYKAIVRIIDSKTDQVLDEVIKPVGLRWFSFDPQKGFTLNGQPLKLIGASRHQDYGRLGNAVPNALQVKDVELLKQMGGNFLRVAHYPQDPVILEACDRLGLLASVEIPVVNEITESESFFNNCRRMQTEMIRQNYNHPSVIIWAYMNEVLLRPKYRDDKPKQDAYLAGIERLARELDSISRKEDPARYTMISNHGDFGIYDRAGLLKVPQLIGWNLYQGWYGGKIEDFGPNLDLLHSRHPDKTLLVTEFGADADPRISSSQPERFDKSIEYAVRYHQVYLEEILKRPFVAGAAMWNLADFSSETREETMPHVNNKGLLTLDRKPKDTYFLYNAYLNKQSYIKIGNMNGNEEVASRGDLWGLHPLQVFSNADSVELLVNGKPVGRKKIVYHAAEWPVPFNNGRNRVKAVAIANGRQLSDSREFVVHLQPYLLKSTKIPFKQINISLGDKRYFRDASGQTWFPDQEYRKGSWGHIGGEVYAIKDSKRQSFGSDKAIAGTDDDPIYQTQLIGFTGYKLDVPNGKYEVTLHFSELNSTLPQSSLVYNLDNSPRTQIAEKRVFDVLLNGKTVLKALDLANGYGALTAVRKKYTVTTTSNKGITISFKNETGKAVLNALQVKKI